MRHPRHLARSCLLALALLGAPAPGRAAAPEIHDHSPPPLPGESYGVADFRLAIPPGTGTVRGVLFRVAPHLADSRPEVLDPALLALCAEHGFALLGARLDDVGMETGIGDALLRTLAVFATASGRSELAFTTLYCEGYSWGGQFAYHFMLWRPERVIGLVTMKGGYHRTDPAGEAILVPAYLFVGENDLPYRIANLTGIFEAHRPLGARWILALQPGAGHEPITDRGLLDAYFHAVVTRRLPAEIPPDRVPELRVLPEPESWLGDRTRQFVGAWECYDAARDSACWFPERAVGVAWQDFVSAGAVIDTIACVTAATGATPASARLLPARPNPFNPATVIAFELDGRGRVELRVYDLAGRCVRTLVDVSALARGRHEMVWRGRDDAGRKLPAGSYVCRLRAARETSVQLLSLVK